MIPLSRSNSVPDIHNHIIPPAPATTTNTTNGNNSSNTLINISFSNSRECISNEDDDDSDLDNDDDDNNTSNSIEIKNYMNNKSFRRHSSQIVINTASNIASSSLNTSTDRICSSPINTLKMSSRVCQIKIDEGIELHLSREIKSERDIQNTLKLKSSYDELNLTYDEDQSSSNSSSSKFKRYRTSSDSINTAIINQSPLSPSSAIGLLRCNSPSIINNSPNPSPTNKLFITRRSMSPINLKQSIKRKFSDIDNDLDFNSLNGTKRVLNNNNQEIIKTQQFAQPLLINTNQNEQINSTSSSSNNNNFQSPLTITTSNKYTFIPIQNPFNKQQRPNNLNLITTTLVNSQNSPINSPARYCDSPHSSMSIKSTISEKADSGYQSSVQNNSDSESCI